MQEPPVSLAELNEEEKKIIRKAAKDALVRGIFYYLIPFLLLLAVVIYVNMFRMTLGISPPALGWINPVFVIGAVFLARLFVNIIIRFSKSSNAWQKKVIRGKVVQKEGNHVILAGQRVKLSGDQAQKIHTGDELVVSLNAEDGMLLKVEQAAK